MISSVPQRIKDVAKGTPLELSYHWFQYKTQRETEITIDTPTNPISISVPEHATDWYDHSTFEWQLQCELINLLDESDVFYDVGSQFGFYLQLAHITGVPPGEIFGFERAPGRYFRLTREYSHMANIECVEVGAGNGTTVAIDSFRENHPSPTVVKIDVEGGEASVLDGMVRTLEEGIDLYIEIHPGRLEARGRSPDEIVHVLNGLGYDIQYIDHRDPSAEWMDEAPRDQATWLLKATP